MVNLARSHGRNSWRLCVVFVSCQIVCHPVILACSGKNSEPLYEEKIMLKIKASTAAARPPSITASWCIGDVDEKSYGN